MARSEEVARAVVAAMVELGAELRGAAGLDETILIDSGKYVARSYRAGGFLAMWLIEPGVVQFYDAQGNLVRTLSVRAGGAPRRAAA